MTELTEARRHECEVSFILSMPHRANRTRYLDLVRKARGEEAAERLKEDVIKRWEERKQIRATSTQGGKPPLS